MRLLNKLSSAWEVSVFIELSNHECIAVEPEIDNYELDNLLGFIDNPLVVTKTYSIKWQTAEVDLVELAKNRWINQMSQREIAKKMGITHGQVDWNLKKFKKAISELSDSTDLAEILKKSKKRSQNESVGRATFWFYVFDTSRKLGTHKQIYKSLKQEAVTKTCKVNIA